MAIRVRHEDLAGQMQGGLAVGGVVGASKGMELTADISKFLAQMGQRDKEFGVTTQLRMDDRRREDQRYYSQLGQQEARQQSLLYDNERRRQAEYATRQMMGEQQLAQQQMEQQYDWFTQGAKSLDEQVVDQLKLANGMKLSPEGQRIKNEWAGKLRQVQSQRNTLRPEAYNSALGQAMAEFEQLGLDAYTEHVPTAAEEVYEGLVPLQGQTIEPGKPLPPGTYRSVKGVRNGVKQYETLTIPPEEPQTTAEMVQKFSVPASDGGQLIWNPHKQDWLHIKPKEAEKTEEAKPLLPATDRDTFYNSIRKSLYEQWDSELEEVMGPGVKGADGKVGPPKGTGKFKHPDGISFHDYFRKHWKDEVGVFNEMFGDPDKETMIPSEQRFADMPTGFENANPVAPHVAQPDNDGQPMEEAAPVPEVTPLDTPSVPVSSRAEVEVLPVGQTFTLGGKLYLNLGNGQVEELTPYLQADPTEEQLQDAI
jgi:hypothetical protein